MATPIYSALLWGLPMVGGGISDLTVPSDVVWILRDVQVTLQSLSGRALYHDLSIDGLNFYHQASPPLAYRTYQWSGRVVAPGGSLLQSAMDGALADLGALVVSGYILTP